MIFFYIFTHQNPKNLLKVFGFFYFSNDFTKKSKDFHNMLNYFFRLFVDIYIFALYLAQTVKGLQEMFCKLLTN